MHWGCILLIWLLQQGSHSALAMYTAVTAPEAGLFLCTLAVFCYSSSCTMAVALHWKCILLLQLLQQGFHSALGLYVDDIALTAGLSLCTGAVYC